MVPVAATVIAMTVRTMLVRRPGCQRFMDFQDQEFTA